MMEYRWKSGAPTRKLDPQIVGEFLDGLREDGGGLTAASVVSASKAKKSPLHSYFEWDDSVAASRYRDSQARDVINHICVTVEKSSGVQVVTRAFLHIQSNEGPRYEALHTVMSDDEKRGQVLANALREIKIWRNRYDELNELAGIIAEIDRLVVAAE